MKLIIAIIKPFKLDEVLKSLSDMDNHGLTVTCVKGLGRQQGQLTIYRGVEYAAYFLPKLKIEVLVPDSLLDEAVDVIQQAARTTHIGDGKLFVLPVDHIVRVRTGETGEVAI